MNARPRPFHWLLNIIIAVVLLTTNVPLTHATPRADVLPDTRSLYFPVVYGIGYAPELYSAETQFDIQPPTPLRVTLADAALTVHAARLATFQNNTKASAGTFVQMLWTHPTAPTANNTAQIYLDVLPGGTLMTARQIFQAANVGNALPYRLRMDVYTAPACQGFTVESEMIEAGALWRKRSDFGCEPYRNHTWLAIQPTGVITR